MRVLVTGGGGFLGSAIVRRLVDRGDRVTIAARSDYPEIRALGAAQVRGDLADVDVARAAVTEQDAVIHTAAKPGIWGDYDDFYRSNVVATKRLVEAARAAGVRRFVHTSTPSVTFDGTDHENGGPDLPYATEFKTDYAATKAEAERFVLGASDDEFRVVALRPHLIWGPGDPYLLPGVIDRHREGKLVRVGAQDNVVDITYVENGAVAHLQALDALAARPSDVAGRAFFVSDDDPVVLWDFLGDVFEALGLPPLTRTVPAGLAFAAGSVFEATHRLFGMKGEPRITRFAAQNVSTSHWYDMAPARDAFGYAPVVGRDEAWQKTVADLRARGFGVG